MPLRVTTVKKGTILMPLKHNDAVTGKAAVLSVVSGARDTLPEEEKTTI